MPNHPVRNACVSAVGVSVLSALGYYLKTYLGLRPSRMVRDVIPEAIRALMEENPSGLERLPIPSLDETCARYLTSVKALCSDEEFAAHEAVVEQFKNGVGTKLQGLLEEGEKKAVQEGKYPFSFIERDWDLMYNELRCTTPVNVSPYFGIVDEKDEAKQEQVGRAARFVSGFVRWTRKLKAGTLEPDKACCSSAFAKIFATAKIPKEGCDEIAYHYDSKHVVVMCNGHIFTLKVLSEDDATILSVAGIEAKLREIIAASKEPTSPGVQYLTSDERPPWVAARKTLMSSACNAAGLELIDSGIVVVCLDAAPVVPKDLTEKSKRLLTGDGNNRWWDKQQLVVDGAGGMGMIFEHSYSDGTIWGRFIREVMCDLDGADSGVAPLPSLPTHGENDLNALQELHFDIPMSVQHAISVSVDKYAKLQANMGQDVLDFKEFGKNEFKTWGCGPDTVMQLAFQCAYYKLHGKPPPTYEAAATRKFFHGRTETIRSCTEVSTELAKALVTGKATAEMMVAASKNHSAITKLATNGGGYDRHLYALNSIATKQGVKVELFENALYKQSKTWLLSTSNGSQPYLQLFGFGPTTPECYGLGYLIDNNSVNVCVSSFNDATANSTQKMANAIADSLRSMQKLFKK